MKSGDDLAASVAAANAFLEPVLVREKISKVKGLSLIDRLIQQLPPEEICLLAPRVAVVKHALDLLLTIHRQLSLSHDETPNKHPAQAGQSPNILYDPRSRRILHGLFDLVSLEGVYPSLSTGVGIPLERRVQSVMPAGVVTHPTPSNQGDRDLLLLQDIVNCLLEINASRKKGLGQILQDRALVDLVSALGELGFGPYSNDRDVRSKMASVLGTLLGETPTSTLLPLLTSLLHPNTPTWLRPHLSTPLSLVPLRPNGVRQVIEYIASVSPLPPNGNSERESLNPAQSKDIPRGPKLPLEALSHASRLLSSVPSSLSAHEYFTQLAPQLFDILDGTLGPEMGKTAGFVIAGILGRKAYGPPGEAGWEAFARPLLDCIYPSIRTEHYVRNLPQVENITQVLVSASELDLALKRLGRLTMSHPNPRLAKRLLGRILVPLWGLMTFATKTLHLPLSEGVKSLIQLHLKLSGTSKDLINLVHKIRFDGEPAKDGKEGWTFAESSDGRVEIRKRAHRDISTGSPNIPNMIEEVGDINARANDFVSLLASGSVDSKTIGEIFMIISKEWLQQSPPLKKQYPSRLDTPEEGIGSNGLQTLVSMKIIQGILSKLKDKLGKEPIHIFELVNGILNDFIEHCKAQTRMEEDLKNPSLRSLGNIVKSQAPAPGAPPNASEESTEIASIAMSLLTAILSCVADDLKPQEQKALGAIIPSLEILSTSHNLGIPTDLSTTASNLLNLISFTITIPSPSFLPPPSVPNLLNEDRKTYALALSYLRDELIPVRAEGLKLLETLIQNRSPILDIQSTLTLLLSVLQDEDEFIYLSVIRTLTTLADKHGNVVMSTLVERYVDRGEELGLDSRLRVGEGLLRIVQRSGAALVEETARAVGEGMMAVAGRRGRRFKDMEEREKKASLQRARYKEAEEEWGGEVPQFHEDEEETEEDRRNERLAKILEGWEGRDAEEDVRVRASALSILGSAVETNAAGLGPLIISTAVDLAVSVLTLETQEEKAILRRSAAILILSVLKALDDAQEKGRKLGFGFAGENLTEVIRVLRYVQAVDRDRLVREHAETIVEGLDTWRLKRYIGPSRQMEVPPRLENLSDGLLAGISIRPPDGIERPRIEEIE